MKKSAFGRYELHPFLDAIHKAWVSHTPEADMLVSSQVLKAAEARTVLVCRPKHSTKESPSAVIVGPLLSILSFPAPTELPADCSIVSCAFSDDEIVRHIVGECVRLTILQNDPGLAERIRRVLKGTLTAEQCVERFGVKKLSQDVWATLLGFSRAQLARGANSAKRRDDQENSGNTLQEHSFFKDLYG